MYTTGIPDLLAAKGLRAPSICALFAISDDIFCVLFAISDDIFCVLFAISIANYFCTPIFLCKVLSSNVQYTRIMQWTNVFFKYS